MSSTITELQSRVKELESAVSARSAYHRAYYLENKERLKAYHREYYLARRVNKNDWKR